MRLIDPDGGLLMPIKPIAEYALTLIKPLYKAYSESISHKNVSK